MTFSDTEMKELGSGTAYNTHNTTSLIRTLKYVSRFPAWSILSNTFFIDYKLNFIAIGYRRDLCMLKITTLQNIS